MARILFIAWKDLRHPCAGGAEIVHHELSRRLVRDGHAVTHLVPGFPGAPAGEDLDGVRVIRVGRGIFSFARLGAFYRRRLRAETDVLVDVFNCFGSLACLLPGPAVRCLLVHHVQGPVWLHQRSFYGVPRPLMPLINAAGLAMEALQLAFLAAASRVPVLTVSPSSAACLRRLGFRSRRIRLLPEASDAVPLPGLEASAPKEERFTVLTLGLRRMKRPLHVLRAFERLKRRVPEAVLWVAGWGEEEMPLRRYAARRGVRDVHFLGRVSRVERDRLLQRVHVLAAASVREGWGLVVIEANAMGTPVVAYDVPGLRDALQFGNGVLCRPAPRAAADALEEVYRMVRDEPDRYRGWRRAALAAAADRSFDRTAQAFRRALALPS